MPMKNLIFLLEMFDFFSFCKKTHILEMLFKAKFMFKISSTGDKKWHFTFFYVKFTFLQSN